MPLPNLMDLTTTFSKYAEVTLKNANPTKQDVTTLIVKDRSNVIAGATTVTDENTMFKTYLGW